MNQSEMLLEARIPFRSYCDTFWDPAGREDENLLECRRWWICPEGQRRCGTGQCFQQSWASDDEWDCADAEDEHGRLQRNTASILKTVTRQNVSNQSDFLPTSCSQSKSFFSLSSRASRQFFSCFNLGQIGDGHIDCAGAQDERMTLQHCSQSSSMLGSNFFCPSTNTCIPCLVHCLADHRCPRRSDDELWCSREHRQSNCSNHNSFTGFDGRCVKHDRYDVLLNCPCVKDEYTCAYSTLIDGTLVSYRQMKRSFHRTTKKTLRFLAYPGHIFI